MTRFLLRAFILVTLSALGFSSCTSAPTSYPTYEPYPEPGSAPRSASGVSGIEASLSADAPLPTSSSGGTVTGILKAGTPLEPVYQLPFYLGEVIMLKDGRPGLVSLDKVDAPRALSDVNGRFVFLNVPPGKYSLVLDFVIHTLILRDPETGEDIYIDVEEGKIVDLGTLNYPDLDITPE